MVIYITKASECLAVLLWLSHNEFETGIVVHIVTYVKNITLILYYCLTSYKFIVVFSELDDASSSLISVPGKQL